MLERVRKTIIRYNMLPRGSRVAVAVSGGPDSVCLLHALLDLAPSFGVSLSVAHLNHQLRGEESDEDEKFVADLAANLGLPFYRAAADLAAQGNLEQAGRRARREFFASLPVDRVALGHTRDDQAETVLFRMLRGSGLRGLAGIYPVTDGSVPLAAARASVPSTAPLVPLADARGSVPSTAPLVPLAVAPASVLPTASLVPLAAARASVQATAS